MNIRVRIHGVLGRRDPQQKTGFDLALPIGATAAELMHFLAEHCGSPFTEALESSDIRIPRHIRVFSDGEMLSTLEQPLVTACAQGATVNVVVMSPMMGG